MWQYVLRRVLHAVVVVFVVLVAVFLAAQVIGDPVRLLLPLTATKEEADALRASLGLDDPLHAQMWRFFSGALTGDFGDSLWMRQPAFELALDRVGATLTLAVCAIAVSLIAGVALGLLAAARGGWLKRVISVASLGAVSIVEFWAALILIYVFAVQLSLFPTSGSGSLSALILPVAVLSMRSTGRIAQFTLTGVSDELAKPYVRAAVARGIPRWRIVSIHALKNVSVPLVTLTGDEFISVTSTAVLVEVVFAWPGLGSLMLQAIAHRDLPLVEACVLIFTLVVVIVNLTVDLSYGWLDRRARVA
jgi:peptide/nickel transport system permease protein